MWIRDSLATGGAGALAGGGILALAGCSSSPGAEPANSTVAPTLSFETERLDKLYRAALAQGEHLGATGWRSGGWVQNDRTTSRTWCSGGTGDAGTCTGLGDADGTHAQSAYQVSIEPVSYTHLDVYKRQAIVHEPTTIVPR